VGYWREWERLYGIGWLVGWDRVIAVCATFINNDMFTHTLSLSLSWGESSCYGKDMDRVPCGGWSIYWLNGLPDRVI